VLKIDIDKVHHRSRFEMQRIMYSLPRPFFIRRSSSGKGMHLAVPALGEWDWQRYAYDDPMRVDLDMQRERHRLPVRNLLWDVKNGKPAGQWRIIRTERGIEDYIDAVKQKDISTQIAYTNMPQVGRRKERQTLNAVYHYHVITVNIRNPWEKTGSSVNSGEKKYPAPKETKHDRNQYIHAEAPERGLHTTRSRQNIRSGHRRDYRTGDEQPGQPGIPQVEDLKW